MMHTGQRRVTCPSTAARVLLRASGNGWNHGAMADTSRFLKLAEVAELLSTSSAQVYALVRRGDLPAIKLGGRGQWRVEREKLEEFIQEQYRVTEKYVETHPFVDSDQPE
jgi:excisionase family DNA binding protein